VNLTVICEERGDEAIQKSRALPATLLAIADEVIE
jgi:hypothetical protein